MSMTRIDFIGIADALKEAHEAFEGAPKQAHEALDRATREIASVCARSNGAFKRDTFHRAAGYGTGNRERAVIDPNCLACITDTRCRVCSESVYPDSSYASGYRHAQGTLHGADPIIVSHAPDCVARG